MSRHLKHFPLTPEVRLFPDDKGTHYILEFVAGDRPGLLARIAYTLAKANVNVESAKINTLGERAEDVFLLDGARLHDEAALLRLETALYEQLQLALAPVGSGRRQRRLLVDDFRVGEQHVGIAEQAHVAHAHRIEDAIQVVAFVLDDAGVEAGDLALHRAAVRFEAGVAQAGKARHLAAQTRHRQASLPALLHLGRSAA